MVDAAAMVKALKLTELVPSQTGFLPIEASVPVSTTVLPANASPSVTLSHVGVQPAWSSRSTRSFPFSDAKKSVMDFATMPPTSGMAVSSSLRMERTSSGSERTRLK